MAPGDQVHWTISPSRMEPHDIPLQNSFPMHGFLVRQFCYMYFAHQKELSSQKNHRIFEISQRHWIFHFSHRCISKT